ncbi:40S ribosomal protein S3 [Mycena capillaripes]|nr:40S ribosomal protein S3 [Mycena capillaripes]
MASRAQVVANGVFRAELNDFFTRELTVEGYSGCDVRFTHARTETIIRATHTQEVLGEKGRRICELTALFPKNSLELYVEKVQYRGLSAIAQCESLRYKLLGGLAVRRAYYGVLRFVMESGAKYCEVVVSGKLRAVRAKSMKFTDNFMFHSGQPDVDFMDFAVRRPLVRQGVLAIKIGRHKPLPDSVTIHEPPVDKTVSEPTSEQREPIAVAAS